MITLTKDEINQLLTRVKEVYALAKEKYQRDFQQPTVEFKVIGRVAGRAFYYSNAIVFNPILYKENITGFMARTIPHEIAHLISFTLNGEAGKGHGKEWRAVMAQLNADATRCHSYDCSNVIQGNKKLQKIKGW